MTDKARALLARATGLEADAVPATATSADLTAWDSIAHMRLVLALEEHLRRTLSGEEILALQSVEAVAELLRGS